MLVNLHRILPLVSHICIILVVEQAQLLRLTRIRLPQGLLVRSLVALIHAHLFEELLLVVVLHSRVVILGQLRSLVEQVRIVLHLHIHAMLSL